MKDPEDLYDSLIDQIIRVRFLILQYVKSVQRRMKD